MPRMSKDEAIRAALIKDNTIVKTNQPVRLSGLTKEQSRAAAIEARRAEMARQANGGQK